MRLSLTIRIFLGFVAILAVFTATTLYGIYRMDTIRRELQLTSQRYLQLTRGLAQVRTISDSQQAYVERALAEGDSQVRQYLVRYARDFYPRVMRERLQQLTEDAGALAAAGQPEEEARFMAELRQRLERVIELNRVAEGNAAELFDRVSQETSFPEETRTRQRESRDALDRELKLLALNLDNTIAQSVRRAAEEERKALWAVLGLSASGFAVGLLITLLMTRALGKLRKLTEGARAVSRGGFDVHIPAEGGDEVATLAEAFNDMARALKDREGVLARRRVDIENLNAFLENVLHSVATGVVVCNRELVVTVANRAARRLLGMTLVDPVGRSLQALPLGELLSAQGGAMQRILEDGPPLTQERQGLRPEGGAPTQLVDLRVLPFKQPGAPHNVGGLVILIDDVSEREQTRERLLQSERLAAMGRLAAQVAHEIRNPLSSIGLNCELLSEELGDPGARPGEVQSLLGAIAREIDRLTELTEGYLQYARLPDAAKRRADVGALVTDVSDFVRPDFERRGLTLEVEVAADLPQLSIDPSRVRLALLNLLRNAGDVSPPGGQVAISVAGRDEMVEIAVDDQGPGVAEEDQARLFEPFFSTKEGGTGLGLSVTRDVAVEHGGSAGYARRPEGGARFFITLAVGGEGAPAIEPEGDV